MEGCAGLCHFKANPHFIVETRGRKPSLIHSSELELVFLSHFQMSLCPVTFSLSQHFEGKGQEGNIEWLVFFCLFVGFN